MNIVTVIGAGLAGSECAWQLAQRGIPVILREMKPEKKTPAHTTEYFAELCCSNSLRSNQLENAVGLLKEELRRLGSLILSCADETAVEAGGALAVDRHGFAALVTDRVKRHPGITLVPGEVTEIPEGEVVIASIFHISLRFLRCQTFSLHNSIKTVSVHTPPAICLVRLERRSDLRFEYGSA